MCPQRIRTNRARRAIVIGGSMAGLLSARVLSDHFEQVTVIERDLFPAGPEPRAGTPQARHVHALLARGLQIMESRFPGLHQEMLAEGALELELGKDLEWMNPAGWGVKFNSGVRALSFSRGLLDWVVRRRLSALPNINFLDGCDVTELLLNKKGDRITGVNFCQRSVNAQSGGAQEGAQDTEWRASDLVVDASGRASKTPRWLAALGFDHPEETVVNAHLGYASRLYQIPEGFRASWKGIFIQAAPPVHRRGGLLLPIEGNRWLATMVGGDRDYPPTTEEGFLQFARSLRSSVIYDAIKNASPISPIATHRGTENRRRHYERLNNFPERVIVIGDGTCAFNPVYGQGMTTAALGAEWLDHCLTNQFSRSRNDLTGLGRRFQQGLAKLNDNPWMLATGEDYRYPNAEGGAPTLFNRIMHRYMDHIHQLMTCDVEVRRRFLRVQSMLKPPATLFAPSVAIRVARNLTRNFFAQRPESHAATSTPVAVVSGGKTSPS